MKYFWMTGTSTKQYDVLHYMERGACQGIHIVNMSKQTARPLNRAQVSTAMRALQKQGLIEHKSSRWQFKDPEMKKVQFAAD